MQFNAPRGGQMAFGFRSVHKRTMFVKRTGDKGAQQFSVIPADVDP